MVSYLKPLETKGFFIIYFVLHNIISLIFFVFILENKIKTYISLYIKLKKL